MGCWHTWSFFVGIVINKLAEGYWHLGQLQEKDLLWKYWAAPDLPCCSSGMFLNSFYICCQLHTLCTKNQALSVQNCTQIDTHTSNYSTLHIFPQEFKFEGPLLSFFYIIYHLLREFTKCIGITLTFLPEIFILKLRVFWLLCKKNQE